MLTHATVGVYTMNISDRRHHCHFSEDPHLRHLDISPSHNYDDFAHAEAHKQAHGSRTWYVYYSEKYPRNKKIVIRSDYTSVRVTN